MSIELLDKTRRINGLLSQNQSSKVDFNDVCRVVGEILKSVVFVISRKGKILGVFRNDELPQIEGFPAQIGLHLEHKLNNRLLNVLSTKENVNLQTLGFSKKEAKEYDALVAPINIAGERLGTMFMYRTKDEYDIEDIILSEYGTTVIGLEMMRAVHEESEEKNQKQHKFAVAFTTLTPLEAKAIAAVFRNLQETREDTVVTSRVAREEGITRTVIINALKKLESAGLLKTKSSGMKGTQIKVLSDEVFTQFEKSGFVKRNS